jgi:hypothetical protein
MLQKYIKKGNGPLMIKKGEILMKEELKNALQEKTKDDIYFVDSQIRQLELKRNLLELESFLLNYEPKFENEMEVQEEMYNFLITNGKEALNPKNKYGHFVVSVVLFNKEHTKVLLCHDRDKGWSLPEWYPDESFDFKELAKISVYQETKILDFEFINAGEISMLLLTEWKYINSSENKPVHRHYNMLFFGEVLENVKLINNLPKKNCDVKWVDIEEELDMLINDYLLNRDVIKAIQKYK